MCAQVAPSGECLRGYKPGAVDCSRLAPLCGSFLPVLNTVVIPGLRAGICCAVLRGSLLIVCKQVCLSLCNKKITLLTKTHSLCIQSPANAYGGCKCRFPRWGIANSVPQVP